MATEAISVQHLSKLYATRNGGVAKILAGLLAPSGGSASLRGTTIQGSRRDIGVVFQAPVLFPWRAVLDPARGAAEASAHTR